MKKIFLVFFVLIILSLLESTIIDVPQDYPTIQEGIDAAASNDTILVADGEYFENLQIVGKEIMLASWFIVNGDTLHIQNTIINGSSFTNPDEASVIAFLPGNNPNAVPRIIGFTIANGYGWKIQEEIQTPNGPYTVYKKVGGGLYIYGINPIFSNNTITENEAEDEGGGSYAFDSGPNFGGEIIHEGGWHWERAFNPGGNVFLNNSSKIGITFVAKFENNPEMINMHNCMFDVFDNDESSVSEFWIKSDADISFSSSTGMREAINEDVYVSVIGDENNSGLTPEDAFLHIRYALSMIYPTELNPLTINVGSGLYSPEGLNHEVYPLNLFSYLSIQGASSESTILDAANQTNHFVFENSLGNSVSGLSLINGFENDFGGSVSVINSDVSLNNLIFQNNALSALDPGLGGSIYSNQSDIEISDCKILNSSSSLGGGGYFSQSNVIMDSILFINNSAARGGAVALYQSNQIIINSTSFNNNNSDLNGGAIYCHTSILEAYDSEFTDNYSYETGGGLYLENSTDVQLINVTIANNDSGQSGNNIWCYSSNITFNNTICWPLISDNIYCAYSSITTSNLFLSYSDIAGGLSGIQSNPSIELHWLNGNIDLDPIFEDPVSGNYNLSTNSPCIDSGDPDFPLDPDGSIVDMGAYYFDHSSFINADFSADIISGNSPLTVNFTDNSSSTNTTITVWEWDFENDGIIDSYEQNPSFTYADIGSYSVSLSASDGFLEDTLTRTNYILVYDDINQGLTAYYPLDGNANDVSGNGYNGTITGSIPAADRFGAANQAMFFDGIDDNIGIPEIDLTIQRSFSAWVKTTTYGEIVYRGWSYMGAYHYYFDILDTGNFRYGHTSGGTTTAISQSVVNDEYWHHLVATWDGSIVNLYLDGELDTSQSYTNSPTGSSTNGSFIGASYYNYGDFRGHFQGFLDDIRLYNRSLSAAEVQTLYAESGWPLLIADFSVDQTKVILGTPLQFTDLSSGNPTIWEWDFDNDGVIDSNDQNPSYIFSSIGTYSVSLTVSNGPESGTEVKTDFIQILTTNTAILNSGGVTPDPGIAGDTHYFYVLYADSTGVFPTDVRFNFDNQWFDMYFDSGNISIGALYMYGMNIQNSETYQYYFEANSGLLRYPEAMGEFLTLNVYENTAGWDAMINIPNTQIQNPATINPGDDINVQLTVKNNGSNTYNSLPAEIKLLSPTNTIIDTANCVFYNLQPNYLESIDLIVSLPYNVPNGLYVIECTILPDLDEDWSNNSYNLQFYIGGALNTDQYIIEWEDLLTGGDYFYISGYQYHLYGAYSASNEVLVFDPSGNDEVITENEIEFFEVGPAEQIIVNQAVYPQTGPDLAFLTVGNAIFSGGPQFVSTEITGFRGQSVSFTATAPSGCEFQDNEGNYDCWTTSNNGNNYVDDWFDDVNSNNGYETANFEFNIPIDAQLGTHVFYFQTEYEASEEPEHITKLVINVEESIDNLVALLVVDKNSLNSYDNGFIGVLDSITIDYTLIDFSEITSGIVNLSDFALIISNVMDFDESAQTYFNSITNDIIFSLNNGTEYIIGSESVALLETLGLADCFLNGTWNPALNDSQAITNIIVEDAISNGVNTLLNYQSYLGQNGSMLSSYWSDGIYWKVNSNYYGNYYKRSIMNYKPIYRFLGISSGFNISEYEYPKDPEEYLYNSSRILNLNRFWTKDNVTHNCGWIGPEGFQILQNAIDLYRYSDYQPEEPDSITYCYYTVSGNEKTLCWDRVDNADRYEIWQTNDNVNWYALGLILQSNSLTYSWQSPLTDERYYNMRSVLDDTPGVFSDVHQQSAYQVDFSADQTIVFVGNLVQFTDLTVGDPTSWEWDFDNDGSVDSTEPNPNYSYSLAGTYTVSLTVSDDVNSVTEIKENYISVIPIDQSDAKLMLKKETNAQFDLNSILSDPDFNAILVNDQALWARSLNEFVFHGSTYSGIGGDSTSVIIIIATESSGEVSIGAFCDNDSELLRLVIWEGTKNYIDFDNTYLDSLIYLIPENELISNDIRQNLLNNIANEVYLQLFNKGYVQFGPQNYYELYNCETSLQNNLDDRIVLIKSFVKNHQMDYSWYNELATPVDELMNSMWSPIANNPNQNANLERSFEISYDSCTSSALYLSTYTDNQNYSTALIFGLNNPIDYSSNGGNGSRTWEIDYDELNESYRVSNNDCASSRLILFDQYPEYVNMNGFTRWSNYVQMFNLAVIGNDVITNNHQELPTPGDDNNPEPLKLIVEPGWNYVSVNMIADIVPLSFKLNQNYPNPFNPETNISFSLPVDTKVILSIYNIKGQKVKTICNEFFELGDYSLVWNGMNSSNKQVASGIYFYKLETHRFTKVKKMLLLK